MPDQDTATYLIRFVDATPDEANVQAASLEEHLRYTAPGQVQFDRRRTKEGAQDLGATLVLVLGTAAVTAVAKGIQSWLASRPGSSIDITDANGRVVAQNIDAASAAQIAQAWAQRPVR
jgi:hypothetical protein